MKGSIRILILALAIGSSAATAAAQEQSTSGVRVAPIESEVSLDTAASFATANTSTISAASAAENMPRFAAPRVFILATPSTASPGPFEANVLALGEEADGGVRDFLFGTRTRTANTLLLGGVGVGAVGVGVVKGHVGAVMGIAGLLSIIGGLYTHFR